MRKTLSELIAEKHAGKEPSRAARNRAAFAANLEEIKQALGDGWSRKIIWEALTEQGRISFGYDAFLRYARKMIPETKQEKEEIEQIEVPGKGSP